MKPSTTNVALFALSVALLVPACSAPPDGEGDNSDARADEVTAAPMRINFELAGGAVPSGYVADTGGVYGAHGALHYGWSVDHTDVTRRRGVNADPLLDTLAHFHAGAKWELEVPNGDYTVTVSVGDASYASTYSLNAEGVALISNQALGVGQFQKVSRVVHVGDGRLTLDQGNLAEKSTRINYVDVARVADPITWNSGITIGTGDITENGDMIAWRGRQNTGATVNTAYIPLEGLARTPPGAGPWGLSGWNGAWFNLWKLPAGKAYSDFQGMLLFQVGPAGPATVATQAEYDQLMIDGANGLHDAVWQDIGKSWMSYGRNKDNTILWLGHELNGTWYRWNPANIGCANWIKMFRKAALAFKSTGATARIAWGYGATTHATKGGDFAVASSWECYPGDDVVDVIAVDHYDFGMWPVTTDWKAYRAWPDSHARAADFARAHGKKVAIGEWQIIQDAAGHKPAERDNPAFIQMMYNYFRDNADVVIFESMFHIDGFNNEHKYIFPVDATNTKAATLYKSLWRKP
jgi:hypothetical protein